MNESDLEKLPIWLTNAILTGGDKPMMYREDLLAIARAFLELRAENERLVGECHCKDCWKHNPPATFDVNKYPEEEETL